MNDEPVPVADVELGGAEIDAAVEVLESGHLRQGEQTEAFETEFAERVGVKHAVAVSSGTAALHLAYMALLEDGHEVLVPAMSHVSTASMVVLSGATPIFCDLDPETFTLDVTDARERLSGNTTAIAPVHLFGGAADVPAIRDLAEDNGLRVVWDASQAHGTTYGGRDVGGFPDLATYSFYPTKNMTTCEGGIITTDDGGLSQEFSRLRSHGQTKKYYHPNVGFNYRMTDVEAAIGRAQLRRLDELNATRRENAAFLTSELCDLPGVSPPTVPDPVGHTFHQYTVTLDLDVLECTRDEFAEGLEAAGVDTGIHYPRPLHRQPAFDGISPHARLPVSERLCDRVLSLPVHPNLDPDQLEYVVENVQRVASAHTT